MTDLLQLALPQVPVLYKKKHIYLSRAVTQKDSHFYIHSYIYLHFVVSVWMEIQFLNQQRSLYRLLRLARLCIKLLSNNNYIIELDDGYITLGKSEDRAGLFA